MKISVITVCRNAEATISDTLASVASQIGPEIEHIIVDGGSSDRTLEIVRAWTGHPLRVISEKDRGIYDAMSKGLRMATGDAVGFLNADDFFCRTDALALIADALDAAGTAQGISAGIAIVRQGSYDKVVRHYSARGYRPWMMRFGHMPPHPGLYVRTDAAKAVGDFDVSYRISGDFDWIARLLFIHHFRLQTLGATIVTMRQGGASTDGFASKRVLNREISRALAANGISSHPVLVWSKYLWKTLQLLQRTSDYPAPSEVQWRPSLSPESTRREQP